MTEKDESYKEGFAAGYKARTRGWTTKEVKTLIEWTGTDAELAAKLGRSHLAVRIKKTKMRKAGEL